MYSICRSIDGVPRSHSKVTKMKSLVRLMWLTVISTGLVLVYSIHNDCRAQTGTNQAANKTYKVKRPATTSLRNSENPEFKSERLDKPVDLIDLPPYAGKDVEFVTGTLFANVKGGPSATMQFSVHEDPKTVLEWYKSVFNVNKWQMLDNMAGANGLAAMKSNNVCQVMTLGPTKKGAKCDLLLRYKFYKPMDFPNK
jgi:hypothetical protein